MTAQPETSRPARRRRRRAHAARRAAAHPLFYNRAGESICLRNVYRGATAFLLCGGPSLASHNLRLLEQRGVLTCAVNNAATVFRPHLWVSMDDPTHFCDVIWRDPGILKFAPQRDMERHFVVRDAQDRLQPSREVVGDMPGVFGYRHNNTFIAARWLCQDTFNWGSNATPGDAAGQNGSRSVMYVALRLLFHLGVRRLYLLGCDFRMQTGAANYAFPQRRCASSVRHNNTTYRILNERLAQLLPYFQQEGYEVRNCTPNSGLVVFPHVPFEEAVDAACATMPNRILTEGMYDQLAQTRKGTRP
jgi:hypothetical protein